MFVVNRSLPSEAKLFEVIFSKTSSFFFFFLLLLSSSSSVMRKKARRCFIFEIKRERKMNFGNVSGKVRFSKKKKSFKIVQFTILMILQL